MKKVELKVESDGLSAEERELGMPAKVHVAEVVEKAPYKRKSRAKTGAVMGRPMNSVRKAKLAQIFRDFCRRIINKKQVRDRLEAECLINPAFALKLAEFGIGKPFQAIEVKQRVEIEHRVREVRLEDGNALFTEAEAVSDLRLN